MSITANTVDRNARRFVSDVNFVIKDYITEIDIVEMIPHINAL